MLRQILYAEKEGNQPFLIAGSGTMGWDAVGANLIERGDEALVLNTGYFGDAFADWYVSLVLCCWVVEGLAGRRGRKGGETWIGRREGEFGRVELMLVSRLTVLKSPRSKLRLEVCPRTSHSLSHR